MTKISTFTSDRPGHRTTRELSASVSGQKVQVLARWSTALGLMHRKQYSVNSMSKAVDTFCAVSGLMADLPNSIFLFGSEHGF
jgi:hypothetical protein